MDSHKAAGSILDTFALLLQQEKLFVPPVVMAALGASIEDALEQQFTDGYNYSGNDAKDKR